MRCSDQNGRFQRSKCFCEFIKVLTPFAILSLRSTVLQMDQTDAITTSRIKFVSQQLVLYFLLGIIQYVVKLLYESFNINERERLCTQLICLLVFLGIQTYFLVSWLQIDKADAKIKETEPVLLRVLYFIFYVQELILILVLCTIIASILFIWLSFLLTFLSNHQWRAGLERERILAWLENRER